jgi:hypothetical protein
MGKPSTQHCAVAESAGEPASKASAAKAGGGQKQLLKATGWLKKKVKGGGKGGAGSKPKAKAGAKGGAEPKPKAKAGAGQKQVDKGGAEQKQVAKAVAKGEQQVATACDEHVDTPCRKRAKKEIDKESDLPAHKE